MKLVNALQILGNPQRIDRQVACPHCHERGIAFEDGSIMCVVENKCFAPEVTDTEMFEMRRQYDERNGITPSQRLLIPAQLMGELADAQRERTR